MSDEDRNVAAEVIWNKSWRLYKSSPMFNLSLHRVALDGYASNLALQINSQLSKTSFTSSNNDEEGGEESQPVKLSKASLEVVRGFALEKDEPEAILLTIFYQSKASSSSSAASKADKKEPNFVALLCSVGSPQVLGVNRTKIMAHRPLILTKGPIRLTNLVNAWFETNFDCKISIFRFQPLELSWMAAQWSVSVSSSDNNNNIGNNSADNQDENDDATEALGNKPFEFVYSFPDSINDLNYLTLTINPHTIQDLWKGIRKASKSKDDKEALFGDHGNAIMEAIEYHFGQVFHINLSSLCLIKIGTPVSYVSNDGRVKFFSGHSSHTLHVLQHLTSLAVSLSKI